MCVSWPHGERCGGAAAEQPQSTGACPAAPGARRVLQLCPARRAAVSGEGCTQLPGPGAWEPGLFGRGCWRVPLGWVLCAPSAAAAAAGIQTARSPPEGSWQVPNLPETCLITETGLDSSLEAVVSEQGSCRQEEVEGAWGARL